MSTPQAPQEGYAILQIDPWLARYEGDIALRMARYHQARAALLAGRDSLADFANGHLYYGLHRTGDGWIYREWAPGAQALHLVGDFNGWNPDSHPLLRLADGDWEIRLPGQNALAHLQRIKVRVTAGGQARDRIPLYIRRVVQAAEGGDFAGQVWDPPAPFVWTDAGFTPQRNLPPLIYEAHVGMAQQREGIGTYDEFTDNVLPRIKADGYNTVQLMAIMEHPYYASFGYQVSNFFAASSWFGTPDELKRLIDAAHGMGLSVLLDLVHSHAVKNVAEGINLFDGTADQFFCGDHPAWDSKLFQYGKRQVLHFLLSNVKFWLTEYHFDGFRFDGVTSMLYHDHGLGVAFDSYDRYFSMNTNLDALTYLQLASELTHAVRPGGLAISEDMSGMPGMCLPIAQGGLGFDYRLAMGVPDYWIKTIKDVPDEQWDIARMWHELTTRRPQEKNVGYAESHDQALVGDKTIMFRLADKEMYWAMNRTYENLIVERAMALHKMIRLVTLTLAGEGYLNFMGNEFGHPEWVDFPREGNGWSYRYARRQWHLADDAVLRYSQLGAFDQDMLALAAQNGVLVAPFARNLWQEEPRKLLAYEKAGLIFLFNFHPTQSLSAFFLPAARAGLYRVCLDTDDPRYGGQGRINHETVYTAQAKDGEALGFLIYSPARTAMVLRTVPTTL
ncbi:MAG: alpha amylase C-terminal domain-containing protein [Oscillospiraceae bacterium]|jgi:1,4-alpha-glucan branching enzyme|nr:alpha amylase C-terminal domain-containing protein [Oscillospiraceae bacterium]